MSETPLLPGLPGLPDAGEGERVVQGSVTTLRYVSDDGRFAVVELVTEPKEEALTAIGELAGLRPGEQVRLRGRLEEHPVYGERFRALSYTPVLPSTEEGLRRFLGSGLIEGIGPGLADRLVRRFGARTLDVITTQSSRLREVDGIGRKRAEAIAQAVRARREEAETLTFLHSVGLGPKLSARLLKAYGAKAAEVLRGDPYLAAEEVAGIGFLTADRIGRSVGIAEDDPRRAAGAALHLVAKAADEGHTYLPEAALIERAAPLEVPAAQIGAALPVLEARGLLVREGDRLYAPPLHRAEKIVAARLASLLEPRETPKGFEAAMTATGHLHLSGEQREAVAQSLSAGLLVLTGGPGTGKTTTVRALLAAHEALERQVALCAPTGRAAKRVAETTGGEASTIHRLLEWNPARASFARNESQRLGADVVLVDEASMLDLSLACALLRSLKQGATLILVGDVDQLPPVGSGQVLRELIRTELAPTARLTRIFRQAQKSAIVRGAHRILEGAPPLSTPRGEKGEGDLFFVPAEEPERAQQNLARVLERIPAAYGLDPKREVQVLTPTRRGPLGTEALNKLLQEQLNPGRGAPGSLREGDKVMQLRNDYEREVFNGDLGWIDKVEDGVTYVSFEGRRVAYTADDLDALSLAYASTVHKAQGSELPGIVLVLHPSHHVLLARSLLYTAITRAKKLAVIVGSERALRRAARTQRSGTAWCSLGDRLRRELGAPGS